MTHIQGVSNHARERAEQYYGRDLTGDEWRQVLAAIVERKAVLIHANGRMGSEIYAVKLGPVALKVAWVPDRALLTTLMPTDHTYASYREDRTRHYHRSRRTKVKRT